MTEKNKGGSIGFGYNGHPMTTESEPHTGPAFVFSGTLSDEESVAWYALIKREVMTAGTTCHGHQNAVPIPRGERPEMLMLGAMSYRDPATGMVTTMHGWGDIDPEILKTLRG